MRFALGLLLLLAPPVAFAGVADVVSVEIESRGVGLYKLDVTVAHKDAGWEHFVDMWEVVGPDGTVLGKRSFYNPHDGVTSFSSSLSGVKIPSDIKEITVRVHDMVHGSQGKTVTVAVPQ